MAEEKKSDKKPAAAGGSSWHPLEVIVAAFFLLSVLAAVFTNLTHFAASGDVSFYGIHLTSFRDFLLGNSWLFKLFSFAISTVAFAAIVILSNKKGAIMAAERARIFPKPATPVASSLDSKLNNFQEIDGIKQRWQSISNSISLEQESAWRMAIIEADIILDELLDKLYLPGNTIGEKLKGVEKSDFNTIDLAWEAHKVRNMIAHDGPNFRLNQREARLVISLYEAVFKEFYLI